MHGDYLGRICKRGHDHGGGSMRYADRSCVQCRADATRAFMQADPQRWAAYVRKSYKKYPERCRARALAYQKTHRAACTFHSSVRRATRYKATPKWANTFIISERYDLAARRTRLTGTPWEVDHIIPLSNPLVCGLHVEHNLRVVARAINIAKSNKLEQPC